jgi:integrase/recombinase XerD
MGCSSLDFKPPARSPATKLLAMRGDAAGSDRVFPITERRINYIMKAIVKRAGGNPGTSPHWLRHAHASHAIDNGAPITSFRKP